MCVLLLFCFFLSLIAADHQQHSKTLFGDLPANHKKIHFKAPPSGENSKIIICGDMMQSDIKLMKKDQYLKDSGYETLNFFE